MVLANGHLTTAKSKYNASTFDYSRLYLVEVRSIKTYANVTTVVNGTNTTTL